MNLEIQHMAVDVLIPYARNSRTHSDEQIAQVAGSIQEFGFINPILIGDDDVIVAGHCRLIAAQRLNMDTVPAIRLSHLDENQRRALVIADNRIAENAGWDEELLKLELEALSAEDFDLDLLGFDDNELDDLLHGLDDDSNLDEDVPELDENPISKQGDLWILGMHKLLCGDATKMDDIKLLMGDELADMAFTDPPYNVNYANSAKDKMRGTNRPIINDNLGSAFDGFLTDACSNMLSVTKGALYICMSSSELDTLQSAFRSAGGKWSTFIIWAKNTFTLGRADYQRQYEPILYGWKDGNDRYWCGDRSQGDVWFCNKPRVNDLHPTMKPIELVIRALKNSSKTKDIVLDIFGGSGSTLIAAEHTDRRARLIELDPKYVDVIIKRWQDLTGQEAILESSGKTYNALHGKHFS